MSARIAFLEYVGRDPKEKNRAVRFVCEQKCLELLVVDRQTFINLK